MFVNIFISAISETSFDVLGTLWEDKGRRRRRRNQKSAKNDKKIFALSIHLCGRVSFTLKGTYLEIF